MNWIILSIFFMEISILSMHKTGLWKPHLPKFLRIILSENRLRKEFIDILQKLKS